jgi:phosphoribosyl 1,2-cyclic phosphodiesterase
VEARLHRAEHLRAGASSLHLNHRAHRSACILSFAVRVFILSSGSAGNVIVLEAPCGARLLLDAGVNPTAAASRMRTLGADLFPSGALGIVVTHHHGDHIAHAQPLARALGRSVQGTMALSRESPLGRTPPRSAPVFMHAGISAARLRERLEVRSYVADPGARAGAVALAPFHVGPFAVEALAVPHDAPQVALRVTAAGTTFGLATDLGTVPHALTDFLADCDLALLEANYCPRMLEEGPYPMRLKMRVRGPLGHLANEQCAALAARLVGSRLAKLLLGHVSLRNNSPARALDVVASRCAGLAVEVVPNGAPRLYDIAATCRARRPTQLALPFAAMAS